MNKPLRLNPADTPLHAALWLRRWQRRVPRFFPLRFMLSRRGWKRRWPAVAAPR